MLKFLRQSNWLTGIASLIMPFLLFIFLTSQMAITQANARLDTYLSQDIAEYTSLASLDSVPSEQVVMLRGKISANTPPGQNPADPNLVIYQTRPAGGREIRYQEKFPLIFPEVVLDLSDGQIAVFPNMGEERIIQNELHTVTDGDRDLTGFRIGDTITVQGKWYPNKNTQAHPVLRDTTGVTSVSRGELLADWQSRFELIKLIRNIFGVLSLISIIFIGIQYRKYRIAQRQMENEEEWPKTPKTKTAPTT